MATVALTARLQSLTLGNTVSLYWKETKYEFLKRARLRAYSLSVIGFPVMFYLIFGVANRGTQSNGVDYAKYLLMTYSCFGAVGASLFGVGVGLAMERLQGWLEVKQASPMPPAAYIVAKAASCVAFSLIIAAILTIIGVTMAGVHITAIELLRLAAITIVGGIVFSSMGLLFGLAIPPNAAPGIVNLVYLPMSFAAGLWMPITYLPHWLQRIAPILPTYHYAQIALHIVGYDSGGSPVTHWNALVGFTLLFLGLSWIVIRRSDARA